MGHDFQNMSLSGKKHCAQSIVEYDLLYKKKGEICLHLLIFRKRNKDKIVYPQRMGGEEIKGIRRKMEFVSCLFYVALTFE